MPSRRELPPSIQAAVDSARASHEVEKPRLLARATRKPGAVAGMNKLEAAYSEHLERRRAAGEIAEWRYESTKLRLADGAWYTPDFRVLLPNGEVEFHETKGFMREAARIRLRVAAELHPFRFVLVRRADGAWTEEVVGPAA